MTVAGQARAVAHVRVRYAETDQMGVVYYANYLVWFEVGRTELLRSLGWSYREMEHEGIGLPVIESSCLYHRPARYDDELEIRTKGTLLSAVRMQFDYEIMRNPGGELIVSGRTLHAAVNGHGRPARLPARVRGLFT
ncbi:MAG TPA: thioesterase family protein [Vicinamibacterales bacterium]|jgi:acyl-CoA thioester hydrolase|nr:thioesterase family protein [Vicinamibacterales bacterium]